MSSLCHETGIRIDAASDGRHSAVSPVGPSSILNARLPPASDVCGQDGAHARPKPDPRAVGQHGRAADRHCVAVEQEGAR